MKKTGILSVFLALTFLVNCLTGCGENASEEMSGSWRLISYTADGRTYDEASLAQYGIYITMTLNEHDAQRGRHRCDQHRRAGQRADLGRP